MSKVIIFGDSEYAKQVFSYLIFEDIDVIAFTQNKEFISKKEIEGRPVIAYEELTDFVKEIDNVSIMIAIGYTDMNHLREKVYNQCVNDGYKIFTFISKHAIVYDKKNIDEGSIILPQAYIGPNVKIGKCTVVGMQVLIPHDAIVGNYVFLAARACSGGFVNVQSFSFIGLGTIIKNGIEILEGSFVGASSYVLNKTDSYGVYYGNPAKKIMKNSRLIDMV